MIFAENQHGFEYIAFVGEPTLALSLFAMGLYSLQMNGDDWKRMRLPLTHEAMMAERRLIGIDGVELLLLQEIGGRECAWIPNRYPYDGLFPLGLSLLHECFYKPSGDLGLEEMTLATKERYKNQSVLIFKNGSERKSVKNIDHAQCVSLRPC